MNTFVLRGSVFSVPFHRQIHQICAVLNKLNLPVPALVNISSEQQTLLLTPELRLLVDYLSESAYHSEFEALLSR